MFHIINLFDLRHHGQKRCVLRHNADYTILQFTLKCTNIMKNLVRWQNWMRALFGPHFVFAHSVLVIDICTRKYIHHGWKWFRNTISALRKPTNIIIIPEPSLINVLYKKYDSIFKFISNTIRLINYKKEKWFLGNSFMVLITFSTTITR